MNMLAVVGLTILVAYYAGHLARRGRLPSLIGYMILGVVLGSSGLGVLDSVRVERLGFLTELALGFVALSIGMELSLRTLKHLGRSIVFIILAESFGAFLLVTLAIYLVTGDAALALIFGAMAPASAPAGTVAVIQECRARGSLTQALYAVVGFDDGLAIVIFGFAAALAKSLLSHEAALADGGMVSGLLTAARELGLSLCVGGVLGLALGALLQRIREKRDLLVLVFAAVLVGAGLSVQWHLSLILTNMVMGFVLVNRQRSDLVHDVAAQLLGIMPLLFIPFFCLAGAHLRMSALPALGLVGAVYIVARSCGLVGGAWVGATLGRAEAKLRKYVGFGILSQAGVAIGLSLVIARDFAEIGTAHAQRISASVLTTVAATCIFFEIVGPILAREALRRAGEITVTDDHRAV